MRVLVVERNRMVSRRIARLWGCAGLEVVAVEDPAQIGAALAGAGAGLIGADLFDADAVAAALAVQPGLRAVLWSAEPLERPLRHAVGEPRLSNLFGRAGFDVTPRDWELVMVARRLARDGRPPFSAYLAWGAGGFEARIGDSAEIDAAVARVQQYVDGVGVPKRVAQMFGELAHELLMNAVYDAPVDAEGRPRHAHDRKARVSLSPAEAATLRIGCDGARLALQVADPFGRLERRHVFEGLARGLAGGQLDRSHGGAGLGLLVCHSSTVALVFDVVRGQATEVTGLFDLDLNLREFRTQARSLHYFEAP